MKRLSRIIMINWYLFDAKQWDIIGDVALIGKNGSGKSSFIDALQLVLLGGNKSDWHPNAKASDKKKSRDVRGYILGLIKDESAVSKSASYQPREHALCRIVLVFHDDETDEEISIGAALSARRSDPDESIEGYFIVKGSGLELSDFIETTEQGEIVKPYEQLRVFLRNHVKNKETGCHIFGKEPKKFVEQMLRTLGSPQRPPSLNKYRRSFKQSINLSGLEGSVSEFVKYSILESHPLNLEQMRQSIASYQNKKDAVIRINKQISDLKEIQNHFHKAYLSGQRRAGYSWCMEEMAMNATEEQIDQWRESIESNWHQRRKNQISLRSLEKERDDIQNNLEQITSTINQDESETKRQSLADRITVHQTEIQRCDDNLSRVKGYLSLSSEVLRYKNILSDKSTSRLHLLEDSLKCDESNWPLEVKEIDDVIKNCRDHFSEDIRGIDEQRTEEAFNEKIIGEKGNEIHLRLERLKSGQADLKQNTQVLIAALNKHNIKAVPVCELAEISDSSWQPVIEAYLKGNTEALIVAPHQAKQAIDIYRGLKKQVFDATVVNTERVQNWNDDIKSNTAAELIDGEDSLAVKYLQRLLLNIELTDKTGNFMKKHRALTKDGMFINQAGVKRLRLPDLPIMGAGAKEQKIIHLEEQRDALVEKLLSLKKRLDQYSKCIDVFNKLTHHIEEAPVIMDVLADKIESKRKIDQLLKQIEAIDTKHLDTLKAEQEKLREQQKINNKAVSDMVKLFSESEGSIHRSIEDIHEKQKDIPLIAERRKEYASDPDFTYEKSQELLDKLENELSEVVNNELGELKEKVRKRIDEARTTQQNEEADAKSKLAVYKSEYRTETSFSDALSTAGFRVQIETYIHELEDIGLQEYQQEVIQAMEQVIRVVRQDLAIRLKSHINKMRDQFRELNKELKMRPFSANQIYQFRYDKLTEYSNFLTYVESVTEYTAADVNSLFDQDAHLNDYIHQLLDEEQGETLADYRNYFKYDIEIQHPEDDITELLSKRMGNASGGEHKTPYYVAMGAALASAYRLERKANDQVDGGLSLYLADEAFEKMDHTNTVQAAHYLKSIGLQLFIAAPDDAEPKLRQIVDTVLYFMREGDAAEVSIDYIKPEARALLSQLNSIDTDREVTVA